MNYAQLDKEYQILLPLNLLDKEIFVCCSNKDYSYRYFELCGDNFTEANADICNKLNTLFKRPDGAVFNLYFSKKVQPNNKQIYEPILQECIYNILNNIKSLREDTKLNVISNFKHLKIIEYNEADPSYQLKFLSGSAALFVLKDNTIVLPSDAQKFSKEELRYNIQHELIHCATNSKLPSTNGFVKPIVKQTKVSQYVPVVSMFIGLNEVMTEYVNNEIIKNKYGTRPKDSNVAYDTVRVALTPLLKELDQNRLLECFYSYNLEGLVELVSKQFHIKDQSLIYRLFSLADTALNADINMEYSYDADIVFQCYNQLFITVSSFIANKHLCEGKSLSNLKIDFFNDDADYANTFFYKCMKNSKKLSNFIQNLNTNSVDLNSMFGQNYMLQRDYQNCFMKALTLMILGLPFPDEKEFDVVRNYETFNILLNENNAILDQKTKVLYELNQENLIKKIVNPSYNYLPKDAEKSQEIIDKILMYSDKSNDLFMTVPTEHIVSLCNRNKGYLDKICYQNFNLLMCHLDLLTPQVKTDSTFEKAFINYCIAMQNEDLAVKMAVKMYLGIPEDYRCDAFYQYNLLEDLKVKVCKNKPNKLLTKFIEFADVDFEKYMATHEQN